MTTFISTTIELWPVEKLIPYDRNARTHSDEQIEQIARSIQEFGFTNPILVDTGAGILAGHARLRGALQGGLPQVPVIVLDHLSEGRKARLLEIDPVYVDVAVRRWQQFTGKQATRAGDSCTFDEIAAGGRRNVSLSLSQQEASHPSGRTIVRAAAS